MEWRHAAASPEDKHAHGSRQAPRGPFVVHPRKPRGKVSAQAPRFQPRPEAPERLAEVTAHHADPVIQRGLREIVQQLLAIRLGRKMLYVATASESNPATWAQGANLHSTIMKELDVFSCSPIGEAVLLLVSP